MHLNTGEPEVCEDALNQLIELQQEHGSRLLLQSRHFAITMSAFAAKAQTGKAEEIFRQMETLSKEGNNDVELSYQVGFKMLMS